MIIFKFPFGPFKTNALLIGCPKTKAAAAVDPDDTTFTAVAGDLIGVGSDTSQHALKLLADGWNDATPAPSFRVATFAALGGGTIPLPSGAIARPNGSGAGKSLLYGAGNNTDIDFARSSSAQNGTETSNGLQSFPFALDTLVMAVSNSVPSNAPTSLTPAQIVDIYKGNITNWNQIPGGTAGVIAPKIPQAGSGTRSFFVAQLKTIKAAGVSILLVEQNLDIAHAIASRAIVMSAGRVAWTGLMEEARESEAVKEAFFS